MREYEVLYCDTKPVRFKRKGEARAFANSFPGARAQIDTYSNGYRCESMQFTVHRSAKNLQAKAERESLSKATWPGKKIEG